MVFFLGRSLYGNYKLEQQISYFHVQNQKFEKDIYDIKDKVGYFSSDQYKDKYAKEVLNKLNPGEKVLVLSVDNESILLPESEILKEAARPALLPMDSWKEYFFGKDELEGRVKE